MELYCHPYLFFSSVTYLLLVPYMPMRGEVDLRSLLGEFPEKHWLPPRILPGEDGRMDFHEYDPHNLIVHPYGIWSSPRRICRRSQQMRFSLSLRQGWPSTVLVGARVMAAAIMTVFSRVLRVSV